VHRCFVACLLGCSIDHSMFFSMVNGTFFVSKPNDGNIISRQLPWKAEFCSGDLLHLVRDHGNLSAKMFHKLLEQCVYGVLWYLMVMWLQIYCWVSRWNNMDKCSAIAERGPFGHDRHGPKIGGCAPFGGRAGSPSNTVRPGPRSTSLQINQSTRFYLSCSLAVG